MFRLYGKKTKKFPIVASVSGVTAKIHGSSQAHAGKSYPAYVVIDPALDKRKRVWRSKIDDAKASAREACSKVTNGQQSGGRDCKGGMAIFIRSG